MTVTQGIQSTVAQLSSQTRWSQLSEEEVLIWREEEQFFTEEMARIHRKPQILLPRPMAPEVGYRLFFEADVKRAYLSYPMQHVAADAERGLADFKARLSKPLIVFDPGDVNDFLNERAAQVDAAARSDGSTALAALRDSDTASIRRDPLQQHIADQIVERDYKLIAQSDIVVVFYDVAVPSPGVISEMKFALENGKRVYGLWLPPGEPSVFFTRYCSVWFRSADALFAQLSADLKSTIQQDATVPVRQQ